MKPYPFFDEIIFCVLFFYLGYIVAMCINEFIYPRLIIKRRSLYLSWIMKIKKWYNTYKNRNRQKNINSITQIDGKEFKKYGDKLKDISDKME